MTFMHRPQLLVVDEPTRGLDPLVVQTVLQLLTEAREEDRTVFLPMSCRKYNPYAIE